MDNSKMDVERWKQAVKAGSNDSNYRREHGMTETCDDYFVDGVQWADEHPIYNILPKDKLSGIGLIAKERQRQIDAEGYDAEHDKHHSYVEFAMASLTYLRLAILAGDYLKGEMSLAVLKQKGMETWPWGEETLKPSGDVMRMIEKGCALGAAAIDRMKMDK